MDGSRFGAHETKRRPRGRYIVSAGRRDRENPRRSLSFPSRDEVTIASFLR